MIFTYTTGTTNTPYTITFNENTECDILIVGGGGVGDGEIGGGGGGGAVLYAQGVIIQPNTYNINVGKGGAEDNNGNATSAFGAICLGGGSTLRVGWATPNNGRDGGSGSGGSSGGGSTSAGGGIGTSFTGAMLASGKLYNGNFGGFGGPQLTHSGGQPVSAGGGGGANQQRKSTTNTVRYNNASNHTAWFNAGADGSGGDGVLIHITGTDYLWGGGGGGGSYQTLAGMGGKGGGGGGSQFDWTTPQLGGIGINNGSQGVINGKGGDGGSGTGGGGGGGGWANTNGGAGGSGIVIVKYKYKKIIVAQVQQTGFINYNNYVGCLLDGLISNGMIVQLKHKDYTKSFIKNNTEWDDIDNNLFNWICCINTT